MVFDTGPIRSDPEVPPNRNASNLSGEAPGGERCEKTDGQGSFGESGRRMDRGNQDPAKEGHLLSEPKGACGLRRRIRGPGS